MSGKATMKSFAELMGTAHLPEKIVKLCMRGDLLAEHEAAERELEQIQKQPGDSLAGNGAAEVAERIRELEAEMQDYTYNFRVRSLPRNQYRAFLAEHPIRIKDDGEPEPGDQVFGFNHDTGPDPLLRACLADPELDHVGYERLMEKLNDMQFQELAAAAWLINKGGADIPFSSAASELTRTSTPE